MVAVEPWTQGHQGGSLDPHYWEELVSQGNGLGKNLGVQEEAKATPWLHRLEAWSTETVLWGHRGFFSLRGHEPPPGQGPGAGLGTGILNTSAPEGPQSLATSERPTQSPDSL